MKLQVGGGASRVALTRGAADRYHLTSNPRAGALPAPSPGRPGRWSSHLRARDYPGRPSWNGLETAALRNPPGGNGNGMTRASRLQNLPAEVSARAATVARALAWACARVAVCAAGSAWVCALGLSC